MSNAGKVVAVAVLVALTWAVAPVAEAQPPIRIGATLSQTGLIAGFGQDQLRGYQLCVKHVNEKGGVLGRKVELVHYDDGSNPATAVGLYEKLITQDKVDLVLGPFGSPIADAVADVTEKHRMPMVAPGTPTTSIYRKGRKLTLELVLHDDSSDPATAVRLYEKLITQDKVDLVLGPFSSRIADAVANVTEKHKMPMMTHANAPSIFKRRRCRR